MIVPLFLLFLLGLLEFGMVFDHVLTISYATREGARTGAALAERLEDGRRVPRAPAATSTRTSSPPSSACSTRPVRPCTATSPT